MSTHNPEAPGAGLGAAQHEGRSLALAWAAVICMIVGFGLLVLGLPVREARVPLWIVGAVVGLIGLVLGAVGRIFDNVE